MQTEFNLDKNIKNIYKKKNTYPMHVSQSRGVRCRRRCHMGTLPLSEK